MSEPDNSTRLRSTIGATLVGALAFACAESTAPANRIVPIEVRAQPDLDTLRLYDSVVLRVWADTMTPLVVRWVVGSDTAAADSLVYRPLAAGTAFVQALATFSGDRTGEATRRLVARPNAAPTVTIAAVPPDDFTRVPLGDTIALTAAYADADGDPVEVRWFAGDPDAGETNLLGTGDTIRVPVDTIGPIAIVVEVRDPAGGRARAREESEAYDPGFPAAWRRRAGGFGTLTAAGGDLIVGNFGAKGDGSNAVCECPLVALNAQGAPVWELTSGSGAAPIPAGDAGEVYFADDAGTLKRVSASGTVEWALSGTVLGPIMLPDGSLVVRSGAGFASPRTLRRVAASGGVMWEVTLDSLTSWRIEAAVGPDSAVYVIASGADRRVVRLEPDGTETWRLSLLADGIAVADDSTLIVTGDSVYGVRPGGTVRWSRAPGAASAVVGTGGIGYYYYRIGAIGTLAAFQTTDGSEAWSVSVDSAPTGFGVGPVLTADGAVIFAAGRRFIALDAATGVERWRHQVAGNPMASPLLTDSGLLIVVDATGYVEGLAVGAAPANAPWPMAWGGNRRRGRTNTP